MGVTSLAQLVPGTKNAGDSPPCALRRTKFLCGCIGNVWVTWHWEYTSSFHCNEMGLETPYSQKIKYAEDWENLGQ